MKCLFVDIDGVLNSDQYYRRFGWHLEKILSTPVTEAEHSMLRRLVHSLPGRFHLWEWLRRLRHLDSAAVGRLDRVVRATQAKVVVSSTWRVSLRQDELQALFEAKGFTGEVVGRTPTRVPYQKLSEAVPRRREIVAWLEAAERRGTKIDTFAIVDDNEAARVKNRMVLTKYGSGLTDADADQLIELLGVHER